MKLKVAKVHVIKKATRNCSACDQGHYGSTLCSACGTDVENHYKQCPKCKAIFTRTIYN